MKTGIFRESILTTFLLIAIVAFGACEIITTSNSTQQLVIEEATVERIDTTSSGDATYNLNFTYYVSGKACEVGGYSISFNERSIIASWYSKQLLKPGERYVKSHRFTANSEGLKSASVEITTIPN